MAKIYTFAGIPFIVLSPNLSRSRSSDMTVLHIPEGDINYAFTSGRKEKRYTYDLFFETLGEFEDLDDVVGDIGMLYGPDNYLTGENATLVSLTRPDWMWYEDTPLAMSSRAEFLIADYIL